MDQRDELRRAELVERVVAPRPPGLGGVAAAPDPRREQPADLQAGPALRLPEPRAADERTGLPLHERLLAEAAQLRMAEEDRDLAPGPVTVDGVALAQVAADLGLGHDRRVGVEVVLHEGAHDQAIRLQRRHAGMLPRPGRARAARRLDSRPGAG